MLVSLPMKIVSAANKREHWSAKAKRVKAERAAVTPAVRSALGVMAALRTAVGSPQRISYLPAVVTLTRIAPRPLDDDNNVSGMKAIRDGVADALGIDDADPRVTWRYAQAKGKPKEYALTIQIEARP